MADTGLAGMGEAERRRRTVGEHSESRAAGFLGKWRAGKWAVHEAQFYLCASCARIMENEDVPAGIAKKLCSASNGHFYFSS